MTLNRFMHPRNRYRSKPDFKQLADDYPEFKKHSKQDASGKTCINFKDPDALRALTRCLLLRDFQLTVEIPSTRLIPTLPLRLNYILWIEDLLRTLPKNESDTPPAVITGLDVGTGATCVYPLLGSRTNNWNFVATELDPDAFACARGNVSANKLDESIRVVLVAKDDDVLKVAEDSSSQLDFSMCNPPFFVSDVVAEPSATAPIRQLDKAAAVSTDCSVPEETTAPLNVAATVGKRVLPSPRASAKHFLKHEGTTDGGELDFVAKMVQHSMRLADKIKIYTTMLGKKQSLLAIKRMLRDCSQIQSLTTTEFCQGHQMRWGLAWTFLTGVSLDEVKPNKRPKKTKEKKKHAKPIQFVFAEKYDLSACVLVVKSALESLKFVFTRVEHDESSASMTCSARANHWSHQRRQRRERLRRPPTPQPQNSDSSRIDDPAADSSTEPGDAMLDAELETNKRPKLDLEQTTMSPKPVAIEVEVRLRLLVPQNSVALDIRWLGGSLGCDAAYQLLQYFKNKFSDSKTD